MTGEMNWKMYDEIVGECKKLGILKSQEYGTASLKLFNGTAILCRMNDKIARLNTMYDKPEKIQTDESIDDTINDLINYAIYLRMLREGGIE